MDATQIRSFLTLRGLGSALRAIVNRVLFLDAEREKRSAEALREYGVALQEIAKAHRLSLEVVRAVVLLLEETGHSRAEIRRLLDDEVDRFLLIAADVATLLRHASEGTIRSVEIEESGPILPAPAGRDDRAVSDHRNRKLDR